LSGGWDALNPGMKPQIQRKAQNVDPNAPLTSNQIGPDERLGLNSGESQASYDHRARAAGLSSKGTNSIGDRLADFAQNPSSLNTEDPVFNSWGSAVMGIAGLGIGPTVTNLARALTGDNGSPPTDTNPDTGNKRELVAADILAGDPETTPAPTDQAPVDDGIYSDVRLQDRRRAGTQPSGNAADDTLAGTAAAALDTPQARFIPRKRLVSLAA
jgi:hypothetical protein